ncbi:glutathione S-transferase family protein [Streptomyces galilaeus]|uniref:hypothetical protein n=1 Tax=Streptomyces galilaeus TaxID=33899 RepID=UPI0038F6B669
MTADISRLDVDLHELVKQVARQKFAARMARLDDLLAHPEYATAGTPAPVGERAEWGHLLYDADPDATTPAFPYPTVQEAS